MLLQQAQKATGLTCSLGKYGLPVLEFRRWQVAETETDAHVTDADADAVQAAVISSPPATAEGESDKSDPATAASAASAGSDARSRLTDQRTQQEDTEAQLTRVTLEADRYVYVLHVFTYVLSSAHVTLPHSVLWQSRDVSTRH